MGLSPLATWRNKNLHHSDPQNRNVRANLANPINNIGVAEPQSQRPWTVMRRF